MRNKAAHLQMMMLVLWMSCSALTLLEVGAAQQFCRRAVACAKPPTVDDLQLEEYLGKWYEIGSTATFKLFTEAGLACNQARYSASPHANNLSLLNSGLGVISPLAVAEVGAVNVAARGICGGAREVCFQLAAVRQLSQSLTNLSSTNNNQSLLQLAHALASSANAADQTLQHLADHVSLIQQENGQISQANYSSARSLQSTVGAMNGYVKEASKEQGAIVSLASNLNEIRAQVWEMGHRSSWSEESKLALEQASLALGSVALKVEASSSAIELGLKAVGLGANALLRNGQAIQDGRVSSVTGTITQPSGRAAGKLEVKINGGKAPYWIIGVEKSGAGAGAGAYSAALVYSCSEVAGVTSNKSLFVLSREPEVEKATLDAFLAKAQSLGIYNDCEDPFLLTLQRGSQCGNPNTT